MPLCLCFELPARFNDDVSESRCQQTPFKQIAIVAGIASVRWWDHRLRVGRKRKAAKHQRDEKQTEPQLRLITGIS